MSVPNPVGRREDREAYLYDQIGAARDRHAIEKAERRREQLSDRARKQMTQYQQRLERLKIAFEAVTRQHWHGCWIDPPAPHLLDGSGDEEGPIPTVLIGGFHLGIGNRKESLLPYLRCACGRSEVTLSAFDEIADLLQLGEFLERRQPEKVPTQCGRCCRKERAKAEALTEMKAALGPMPDAIEQGVREDVHG